MQFSRKRMYVRRLADGGQEKGSRERTVMLPDGYHKRYTKQISGYEPLRAVRTPINSMKAQRFKALLKPIVTILAILDGITSYL